MSVLSIRRATSRIDSVRSRPTRISKWMRWNCSAVGDGASVATSSTAWRRLWPARRLLAMMARVEVS